MIRITIELIPHGIESRKSILGIATIVNDGTGGDGRGAANTTGNYEVTLSKRGAQVSQVWRKGRVEGFPRLKLGVYDLLYRGLRNIVGSRNPDPVPRSTAPLMPQVTVQNDAHGKREIRKGGQVIGRQG